VAVAGPLFVAVIRYERLTPVCPGFGDAVFVIDRSALDALTTFNVTGVECDSVPFCALRFTVAAPSGVAPVLLRVTVVLFELASLMLMLEGLKFAVTPAGRLLALRFSVPVKPASGMTVNVYWAEPPGTMVREFGVTLSAKSGVVDAGAAATKVL
jgi:hypothetical protein